MQPQRHVSYANALSTGLLERQEAAAYLTAVMALNDPAVLQLALQQVTDAQNSGEVRDAQLFASISDGSDLSFDVFRKRLKALGFQLTVETIRSEG